MYLILLSTDVFRNLCFEPCKVVGCASGVGLLLAALGPSFLDKGVGTGPAATQVGSACAQTRPGLLGTCLRQA